jgi:arginyl-tRNA synthetase
MSVIAATCTGGQRTLVTAGPYDGADERPASRARGGAVSGADPVTGLRSAVKQAAQALRGSAHAGPEPSLDRPPKPELGDYSSNAAMLLAAPLGESPREVAERIAAELERDLSDRVERIEVAGPGFVNLFLADEWYRQAMASLASAGERLGPEATASPERILVEFVSANPTGPLHVGGGRHAAYGDALVRLLEAVGHEARREYYINDAGGQIERFAASLTAQMMGGEMPEDGYAGDYVAELAERLAAEGVDPGDTETLGRRGVELVLEGVKGTLERFGVRFDNWFSERSLYERGEVEAALGKLEAAGHTYKSEGALWLRTTDFGDDKDRVLIRAGGEPTYLAADVAYHWDKLERGFGRLIDVLGADHHGYAPRLRAAIAGLGADPDAFETLIMRLVHIVEDGERAQMSKRSGDFVSLDGLIDDIGVDAARWFMLWRSHDTTVDLDLELARRESSDNPVYYVQYAHARIASILRKAGSQAEGAAAGVPTPGTPLEPSEKDLVKRLLEFPDEVREAAARRAPHRICAYSTVVAADFHAFYRDCKVIEAEGEGVQESRLALCLLTKRTIAGALGLLGISAPERM